MAIAGGLAGAGAALYYLAGNTANYDWKDYRNCYRATEEQRSLPICFARVSRMRSHSAHSGLPSRAMLLVGVPEPEGYQEAVS